MKRKQRYDIGDKFERASIVFEVKKSTHCCDGCAWHRDRDKDCATAPHCLGQIFVEVVK